MNRRQYLTGIGTGLSTVPIASRIGGASSHISVEIVEVNTPLEGGDLLDMAAELENTGETDERVDLTFLVGNDPQVAGERTVPVEAGATRTVDFLQFQTYPVRTDETFPARLETASDTAEVMIDVAAVDPFDSQYAYPDREQTLTVSPETTVMFEVDEAVAEQQGNIHWFIDGESIGAPMGAWYGMYFGETGRDYFSYTFDSPGSYLVDAAVTLDDGNTASRWEVEVVEDGAGPPTVDATRPSTSELAVDETATLELDVSSTGPELDQVVWWLTQSDAILDVTDVSGTADTASITVDGGCQTCRIEAWVIDENNRRTSVRPWQFTRGDAADETDDGGSSGIGVTILETNSPVTGGEMMTVTAELENTGDSEVTREVDLVVGHDPKVLDTRTVTVPAGGTEQFELSFETYPVRQDEEFPVRVDTGTSTAERSVYVYGTES